MNQALLQQIQPMQSLGWEENPQMNLKNSTLYFVSNNTHI